MCQRIFSFCGIKCFIASEAKTVILLITYQDKRSSHHLASFELDRTGSMWVHGCGCTTVNSIWGLEADFFIKQNIPKAAGVEKHFPPAYTINS